MPDVRPTLCDETPFCIYISRLFHSPLCFSNSGRGIRHILHMFYMLLRSIAFDCVLDIDPDLGTPQPFYVSSFLHFYLAMGDATHVCEPLRKLASPLAQHAGSTGKAT